MNLDLRILSNLELELCQQVSTFSGTIEAKHEQLEASDIGATYLQIHWAYVRLATDAAAPIKLEALKRLAFLSWHMFVGPAIYSGLNYTDEQVMRDSYGLLDAYVSATASPDPELHWMLYTYATWWDGGLLTAITGLPLPALTSFVAATDPDLYLVPERQLPAGAMARRGQMGLYWRSRQVEITDCCPANE